MKEKLIILFLVSAIIAWSQEKIDIFESKTMTFYGLDFTQAKCIGSEKFPSPNEIVYEYYPMWNKLFMDDETGLDLRKPYKKKEVFYDTLVYRKNAQIDINEIITNQSFHLDRKDIRKYIESFIDINSSGLGLLYLVEALNAKEKYLSVWIVFFDKKTGEVLLSEPMRSKGKGRRFKDYWENAFLDIYKDSAKDYKAWKKIYQ